MTFLRGNGVNGSRNGHARLPREPVVGLVEWFEPGEHERVERVAAGLRELGVEHLRTGISWAAWHGDEGAEWYDWVLPTLARDFELLPCVVYTPPSRQIRASSFGSPSGLRTPMW